MKIKIIIKVKIILVCLVVLVCFCLSACQPTPETAPVVNKLEAEKKLQKKVAEPPKQVTQPYVAPAHWQETLFEREGGKFSIVANCEVPLPGVNALPVFRYTKGSKLSQQQVDSVLAGFFGDAELFEASEHTREDLVNWIIGIKKEIADIESENYDFSMFDSYDGSEQAKQRIKQDRQSFVEEYEKQLAAIPENEEKVPLDTDISKGEIFGRASTGSDRPYEVSVRADENGFGIKMGDGGLTVNSDISRDAIEEDKPLLGLENTTREQALKEAEALLERMGLEGYGTDISNVGISRKRTGGEGSSQVGNYYAYAFDFRKLINGLPAEEIFSYREIESDDFVRMPSSEIIRVYISDTGPVAFEWRRFGELKETLNEAVELVEFDEIKDTLTQAIKNSYLKYWDEYTQTDPTKDEYFDLISDAVTLYDLKLSYAPVIEKDKTDSYMLVPVWSAYVWNYGHRRYRNGETGEIIDDTTSLETATTKDLEMLKGRDPQVCVNAVDGSVYVQS